MKLLLLATVALGLTLVDGFSNREFEGGTLNTACKDLFPQHGAAETRNSPYSLTVTNSGNGKKVTISGGTFKGFILQARSAVKGEFDFASENNIALYHVNCPQGPTIRHRSAGAIQSLTVTWTGTGPVTFEGAVVENFSTIYKIEPKRFN